MTILGPVFWYDLIRNGRRTRYLVLRCLYVLLLFLVFWMIYRQYVGQVRLLGQAGAVSQADLAAFGERFFGYFLLLQYAVLLVVTPVYVASAIAEEKQRGTLEYALTTDLSRREIVLGKLGSRLWLLALLVLAGLPVISCAQLLGGISPMLLWCGFAATAVTLYSLTAISMLVSTYARNVRNALFGSYLVIIGYVAIWGFLRLFAWLLMIDRVPDGVLAFAQGCVHVYELANPFMVIRQLAIYVRNTGRLDDQPVVLLLAYAAWHLTLGTLCLFWAWWRVGIVYVRQAYGKRADGQAESLTALLGLARWRSRTAQQATSRQKPPVGDDAMMWKELHVERGMRVGTIGRLLLLYATLAVLAPVVVLAFIVFLRFAVTNEFRDEDEMIHQYVRVVGTILYGLLLLGIGIRAAGCLGVERDRRTYDDLVAAPLSLWSILRAKWLGSMLGYRRICLVLATIWLLGVVTTGIHLLGYVALHVVLLVHAAFAASLGLAFATTMRSGPRAMIATTLLLAVLFGAPPLLDAIWDISRSGWGAFVLGMSPPYVAYKSAFNDYELRDRRQDVLDRAANRWPGQRDYYGRVRVYDRKGLPFWYNWHPTTFSYFCSTYLFFFLAVAASTCAVGAFAMTNGRAKQRPAPPLAE